MSLQLVSMAAGRRRSRSEMGAGIVRFSVWTVLMILLLVATTPGQAEGFDIFNPDAVAQVLSGERTEANAAWWGFDTQDATVYLQAAIDSGARRVIVPNMGSDWVVRPIQLRSNQEIVFEEGVVVTAKPGEFHGTSDSLFTGRDIENVVLRGYGAIFRMQKQDYRASPYKKGEWRMGIALRGVKNVHILGLTIRETGGDGIYLGRGSQRTTNENVVIRDVVADDNYRQGISVITAVNLLVENSVFSNTEGTAPMSGIDIEPNRADEPLMNVVLRNNVFEGNAGDGVQLHLDFMDERSEPVSILIENNVIRGNRRGFTVSTDSSKSPRGEIVFRQNVLSDSQSQEIVVNRKPGDNLGVVIADSFVYDASRTPGVSPIQISGAAVPTGNIEFRNVVVKDTQPRPVIAGSGGRFGDITGNIVVLNFYGAEARWEGSHDGVSVALVPAESAFVYYTDPPTEVAATPIVYFHTYADGFSRPVVKGRFSPTFTVRGIDEALIDFVTVTVDGRELYSGDAVPKPEDIVVDTVALNPDKRASVAHEIKVTVGTNDGDRLVGVLDVAARNYWHLVDELTGPVETLFGRLYYPQTADESDGWVFAQGDGPVFHGDDQRRVRAANTTEYLTWEAPRMVSGQWTLYALEGALDALQAVVAVDVSADGVTWRSVPYTVASGGETTEQGWHRLVVSAPIIDVDDIVYVRLSLRASEPFHDIHVGEAALIGFVE